MVILRSQHHWLLPPRRSGLCRFVVVVVMLQGSTATDWRQRLLRTERRNTQQKKPGGKHTFVVGGVATHQKVDSASADLSSLNDARGKFQSWLRSWLRSNGSATMFPEEDKQSGKATQLDHHQRLRELRHHLREARKHPQMFENSDEAEAKASPLKIRPTDLQAELIKKRDVNKPSIGESMQRGNAFQLHQQSQHLRPPPEEVLQRELRLKKVKADIENSIREVQAVLGNATSSNEHREDDAKLLSALQMAQKHEQALSSLQTEHHATQKKTVATLNDNLVLLEQKQKDLESMSSMTIQRLKEEFKNDKHKLKAVTGAAGKFVGAIKNVMDGQLKKTEMLMAKTANDTTGVSVKTALDEARKKLSVLKEKSAAVSKKNGQASLEKLNAKIEDSKRHLWSILDGTDVRGGHHDGGGTVETGRWKHVGGPEHGGEGTDGKRRRVNEDDILTTLEQELETVDGWVKDIAK